VPAARPSPRASPEQVRNIADVTTAVANGDLSQQITVDVKGEILELKDTINTMVGQLSSFSRSRRSCRPQPGAKMTARLRQARLSPDLSGSRSGLGE
jgi:hypothetical protein